MAGSSVKLESAGGL